MGNQTVKSPPQKIPKSSSKARHNRFTLSPKTCGPALRHALFLQENRKTIEIVIVDDNVWEPDETFFVKLSLPDASANDDSDYVTLGRKSINQITIINDDGEDRPRAAPC